MSLINAHIADQVCKIARQAGELIRNEARTFDQRKVEIKGSHDFVSYVDKSSEAFIVKELQALVPEAGFLVEENTVKPNAGGLRWIVDPLDGTTSFLHGYPFYAVSIALVDGDEPLIGVVYHVPADVCYYTWKGAESYRDGQVIHVSKVATLARALGTLNLPARNYEHLDAYMELCKLFTMHTDGLRIGGATAIQICQVAEGSVDFFFTEGHKEWDIAAGMIILENAGGKYFDYAGDGDLLSKGNIVCTNALLEEECKIVFFKHIGVNEYDSRKQDGSGHPELEWD